ncbi:MAG: hypothetical protein V4444_03270 [Pseudomonadota bacterium]
MSRVLHLQMSQADATQYCTDKKIGVSAVETLPSGAIRLVCMSVDGAERARKSLKSKLVKGDMVRQRHRPTKPLW